MIEPAQPGLSIARQCKLVSISRSGFYYQPAGEDEVNLGLMRLIDEAFTEYPFYGSRQMMRHLYRLGHRVRRGKVSWLIGLMGLAAIYQRPRTTLPGTGHKSYPYLLRDLSIARPNQVWCADITYLPMRRGFLYLVALMDWFGRRVMAWRLSNSMHADFCVEALQDAMEWHGKPEIFNTDQGNQFTGDAFTGFLKEAGVRISMEGRGRWMDNVFIERLRRSLKYECVYSHAFETDSELHAGLARWIEFYNAARPHSVFAGRTPDEVYFCGGLDALPRHAPAKHPNLQLAA